MKYVFPLFVLSAVFVAGCAADASRRDLYRPAKADGPWTRSLYDGTWREGVPAVDARRRASARAAAPAATPAPAPAL